ncbi:tetratricopeptide repeat protein [Actinacidiphila epipremni]|uniref:tetratricopeptide repeat protein n=1 Tax=Actinacidiphila epipremni TaxID=2053013 RepID=UPI002AFEE292|nr:tetratricopeptide repeat protein [Actinacidiphila epipremni]
MSGEVGISAIGGSVAAQRIGTLNYHAGQGRAPVANWPQQVGVIPPKAGAFQQRAQRVGLREALAEGGTAVLTGTGGVGKTQLAAEYVRTALADGEVDLLVWVTASGRTAVVERLAQAGARVAGADAGDPQGAAEAFVAWLEPKSGQPPCRWLVVLDDVADPADMAGLWPPQSPSGRTLVTTRRLDVVRAGADRRGIGVGVFTPEEAAAYLRSALAGHEAAAPDAETTVLAAELGHLPLALSQAAAYIVDAEISVRAYRDRLAGRTSSRVRRLEEVTPDTLPDEQRHTMAAAWELSVEYANGLRPKGLARPMLELASFLAPSGIPLAVLTSAPALAYLGPEVTADDAVAALRALHRLSLVTAPGPANPEGADEVRVHQLVQRATRDALTPERFELAAGVAAAALMVAWPAIERDTALVQALRACTVMLIDSTGPAGSLYRDSVHMLLFRFGSSLGTSGHSAAATSYFRTVAEAAALRLGPDHPHTLMARGNHASWSGQSGERSDAAAALAELLPDMRRVFGPDHAETLAVRHNLAYCRAEAGDAEGAVIALAELLDDQTRVLGPDHRRTLMTRHNLACWRGEAGDGPGAAAALTELVDDLARALGPDHPDTFRTRHSLATWRGWTGDAAGAFAALRELLPDVHRVLGPDSPETLTLRHNLAHWRAETGDPAGAAKEYAEILADQQRVLGPHHSDTVATLRDLAFRCQTAGDAAGAAEAFTELLDRVRALGPDHPYVLVIRHNLAACRGQAGDAEGAKAAFAELADDCRRTGGPDCHGALTARHELAKWRGKTEGADVAVALLAELLPDMERTLGPDHIDTLTTRYTLANFRGATGDTAATLTTLTEVLTTQTRTLGPPPPPPPPTRHALTTWRTKSPTPTNKQPPPNAR